MSKRKVQEGEHPIAVVAMDHNTAAEALGLSPSRLRQHVRLGDVTPHFSGTKPVYLVTDLERFIERLPTRPEHLIQI
ncbi:hypothetical protein GCM10027568_30340 [Humibacter soli]